MKNFSEACERNKEPILNVFKDLLPDYSDVLEVGSGSGQHAIHFANYFPHLKWQTSELSENIEALKSNLLEASVKNILMPVALDVAESPWKVSEASVIYTANTFHIMSFENVRNFFKGLKNVLKPRGLLCVYGPFKYEGEYTSESNAKFQDWLKSRNPESGIRDFEAVEELAMTAGLEFLTDYKMPANNQFLIWKKTF